MVEIHARPCLDKDAERENKRVKYQEDEFPEYDISQQKASFEKLGELLVDTVVRDLPDTMPLPEKTWVKNMLDYNVKGGKMIRGLTVVDSGIKMFEAKGRAVTCAQLNKLAIVGWCVEWVQGWMLMADDIMDESTTRRGRPSWYSLPHVRATAVNDAFLVETLVYRVLKRYFRSEACYMELVDLFRETIYKTGLGQLADTQCKSLGWKEFTSERFEWISEYKTSYYSFYLPVALGMIVSGVTDSSHFTVAEKLSVKMGIYFQAQDDFMDAFTSPEQLGKIGTDIQDRKCSWLFVHALKAASTVQKTRLLELYGNCQAGSSEEQEVKDIYRALGLSDLFQEYAQGKFNEIQGMRSLVEEAGLPWSIFDTLLSKIHKRRK